MIIFQAYCGLDLKSKLVSGYYLITNIFLDLSPVSYVGILPYFGHLTLFVTVQVILRSNMTMASRAKFFGLMVIPWKYFHIYPYTPISHGSFLGHHLLRIWAIYSTYRGLI